MNNRPKKLRGLSLLQAVKGELSDALEGQEISEMELFSAANQPLSFLAGNISSLNLKSMRKVRLLFPR